MTLVHFDSLLLLHSDQVGEWSNYGGLNITNVEAFHEFGAKNITLKVTTIEVSLSRTMCVCMLWNQLSILVGERESGHKVKVRHSPVPSPFSIHALIFINLPFREPFASVGWGMDCCCRKQIIDKSKPNVIRDERTRDETLTSSSSSPFSHSKPSSLLPAYRRILSSHCFLSIFVCACACHCVSMFKSS